MRYVLAVIFVFIAIPVSQSRADRDSPPQWWVRGALCVHKGEGAWDADTGNGYYGGMQMDKTFQRRYGWWFYEHFGTADRWPIPIQLKVAYRGWLRQGWGAWPNTARACGLL